MTTPIARHTPGPWTVRDGTNIYGKRQDVGYKTCIANAGSFSSNEVDTTAENQANARLIAAAPDLLAVCKSVLIWIDPPPLIPLVLQLAAERLREVIEQASCEAPE